MRIFLKYKFKYILDNRNVQELAAGEYEVPRQVSKEVADLALGLGQAVIVPTVKKKRVVKKEAPENKVRKGKRTK